MQKSIQYPKVKVSDVLKAFWRGIEPQKWWFYFLVICIAVGNIMPIITPILYKNFFDVVYAGGDRFVIGGKMLRIIILIAAVNFLYWLFYRLAEIGNIKYQMNTIARLKQNSYDHLIQHSHSFFTNNFVGSLVQKVNRFARAYERLSDHLIWDIVPLCVRLIAVFVIVFFINKIIAFIILIWAIVFILFNIVFSQWKLKFDIRVAEIDSKTTGYLADTLTNQNTISLFNGFKRESGGFKKVTDDQAKITKFTWSLDNIINGGQFLLTFIIEFILFYYAIFYWQQGLITVGVFVLLQAYLINLLNQLWGITRTVRDVYQGYADAKEMVEIIMLNHEIKDIPNAKSIVSGKGEIEFYNVSFAFNQTHSASLGQARKVLEKINLKVRQGERIALVGPSGAGKTTFVRLLLRFYYATAGKILVNGVDIKEATQESLRNIITMVPQDPILFHRTLAENISYGKPGASKEEIEQVAKLAHCDEFIKNLPQGLETYVGERGIKLSGGERQRVAIARAILKNSPILILDEATSSLDSHSEMLIQDALANVMKNRTTIVIAHRLSTIQKMDRIIVIDEGKIIEEGSHSELLASQSSLYRKLWTLQAGGFITDENDDTIDLESRNA